MNYTTMKEVTKDEFYGIINESKLDVPVPTDSNMAFDASTTQNLLKYLSSAVLAGRARFFDMSNKLGVLETGYSFGVALKSKTKDGVKYVIIFDMTTLTKPQDKLLRCLVEYGIHAVG